VRGFESVETVYAIAILAADKADSDRLLALSRSHWGLENRMRYVRDVTCGEDQCRTTGTGGVSQHRSHNRQKIGMKAHRCIRAFRRTSTAGVGRRYQSENGMIVR